MQLSAVAISVTASYFNKQTNMMIKSID